MGGVADAAGGSGGRGSGGGHPEWPQVGAAGHFAVAGAVSAQTFSATDLGKHLFWKADRYSNAGGGSHRRRFSTTWANTC